MEINGDGFKHIKPAIPFLAMNIQSTPAISMWSWPPTQLMAGLCREVAAACWWGSEYSKASPLDDGWRWLLRWLLGHWLRALSSWFATMQAMDTPRELVIGQCQRFSWVFFHLGLEKHEQTTQMAQYIILYIFIYILYITHSFNSYKCVVIFSIIHIIM